MKQGNASAAQCLVHAPDVGKLHRMLPNPAFPGGPQPHLQLLLRLLLVPFELGRPHVGVLVWEGWQEVGNVGRGHFLLVLERGEQLGLLLHWELG